MPPGIFIFEDPPTPRPPPRPAVPGVHAAADGRHRAARCGSSAPAASTRSSAPAGSTSSPTSAPQMPMRTIGMLLGIPEEDQEAIRERDRRGPPPRGGRDARGVDAPSGGRPSTSVFAEYIDWRAEHPSDDLMTELLHAEFEDETATGGASPARRSSATSASSPAAGNETTHPAHRLDRQGAGRAPRPAPRAGRGPEPDPQRHRGAAPVRGAVTGAGPLRHRTTSSTTARRCRPGSAMLLLNASANRDDRDVPRRRHASTSTARSTTTCPSATASTSASAPRWPASRAGSPSTRCCSASPSGRSTGTTPCRPAPRRVPRLGDPVAGRLTARSRASYRSSHVEELDGGSAGAPGTSRSRRSRRSRRR